MAREQQEETGDLPCCTDAHGVLAWISALFRAYLVQSGWFCTRRMLVMRLLGKPPCFSHHPITISVSASSSLNTTQAFQSSPDMLSYLHPYTDCPSLTHSLTHSPAAPPQRASDPGTSSYLHLYTDCHSLTHSPEGPPQSASDPGITSYLHPYIAAGSVVMHHQGLFLLENALQHCLQLCKGTSRMICHDQMHFW